ncbi:MAG: copper amine oxidase N-terminal domain-containing protein [Caldisericia bacterium]
MYVNDKPTPVNSEGFYNTSIELNGLFTDVELKIEDEFNRYLMIKRRIKKTTIRELAFHNDESSAWTNGNCRTLDASPYIKNGRTLVPIRFIAEQLDFVVSWDQTEKVDISKTEQLSRCGSVAAIQS